MKTITTITLLFFALSGAFAQEKAISAETHEFFLDFTAKNDNPAPVPRIVWKSPAAPKTSINSRRYHLKLNIRSGVGLEDVKVFLNDHEVVSRRGFAVVSAKELSEYEQVVDTEILLRPGENKILVSAKNKKGGLATSIREIKVVTSGAADNVLNRKDFALLFATDEYEHWDDLQNPVNDVMTIAEELRIVYGFEVEIVKNATKREVLQKLRQYTRKNYMENDQLFIMFAGHGLYDPLFNQGYLVCKNSMTTDEERLSYISHSNLRNIIDNIPSKHIFLAIDACFGGTFDPFIRSSAHRGGMGMYDELEQFEYINRKLKLRTRKFLTSGGKEYVSDGRPGQHSPFVRKILEAFRSYGGEDNVLTLSEIKSYVEKIDPEPRFGEFGTDQPGSDFIFIVK